MTDNIVPFPPRLRLVDHGVPTFKVADGSPVLVDHGGRAYRLAEVEVTMPRSGQAAWDEVVRRWPALAEEIVAGCGKLHYSSHTCSSISSNMPAG